MSKKQTAVVDAGTLISMALVKLPNGKQNVNGLAYMKNSYKMYAPYSVVEEINAIAADKRNKQSDETQEAAQFVMQNADNIFEKVYYDDKNRNPNSDINRFNVVGVNGETDKKLSELDCLEDPNDTADFYNGSDTYNDVKGRMREQSDMDGGERHVVALAAKSAETDDMPTADVVLSDDMKSLDDINNITNTYRQGYGHDKVQTLSSGGYLGALAKSSKPVSEQDARKAGTKIMLTREWNNDEPIDDQWSDNEKLDDAFKHFLGGTVAYNVTMTQSDVEKAKEKAQNNAASKFSSGGFKGYPITKAVTCGKSCGGCPHGPYLYDVWREDGKTRWEYRGTG